MPDDATPTWLEDELDAPRTPSRPMRWLLLAGAPWLALVAWLAFGTTSAPAASDPAGDAVTSEPSGATLPPSTGRSAGIGPSDPRPPPVDPAGDTVGPLVGDVLAVAVLTARALFVDPGPQLPVPGLAPTRGAYLEHVLPEAIDVLGEDAVVVVLRLVILPVEDDGYGTAAQRRLAVPLTTRGGDAQPSGTPWWLPVRPLALVEPELTAVEDHERWADAADALLAAGYHQVEVHDLQRTTSGVHVAVVSARTPDGVEVEGPIWLDDRGGMRVAGTSALSAPPIDDHG